MKLTITKEDNVWLWQIAKAGSAMAIAGGYCATKADAQNDARMFLTGRYNRACETHKAVDGYTSEEWRRVLNTLPPSNG